MKIATLLTAVGFLSARAAATSCTPGHFACATYLAPHGWNMALYQCVADERKFTVHNLCGQGPAHCWVSNDHVYGGCGDPPPEREAKMFDSTMLLLPDNW